MNIVTYKLERLTRWEFFQLTADALSLMERNAAEMPASFQEKLTKLRTAFDIYDIEIVQERQHDNKLLLDVEEECNYAILTLYKMARSYKNYKYSPQKEEASKELLKIFRYYGSGREISRQSQTTKAAILINLLQDLAKDLPKQHIATLNLTDAVVALQTNTQIFDRELHARSRFKAEFVPGVAKNARLDVQQEFMEMVALINALAIVEGEEKYATLKLFLNTLVQKYVSNMRQRTKKKEEDELV